MLAVSLQLVNMPAGSSNACHTLRSNDELPNLLLQEKAGS